MLQYLLGYVIEVVLLVHVIFVQGYMDIHLNFCFSEQNITS